MTYLHGIHDEGGESLMSEAPGWIVISEAIGDDPDSTSGMDYSDLADQGFSVIVRLNYGYFPDGTIPTPDRYERFSKRVASFIQNSEGCTCWIIGNEPNHAQERPEGQPILPLEYARCFALCSNKARVSLIPAAIAPWNVQTPYEGNEHGDWIMYFEDMLREILRLDISIGGIALHTYTHGAEPALITSVVMMDEPFWDRYFQFRAYRDFLDVVPTELQYLPVYITETDQDDPWLNGNNGWVQAAYREIDGWNRQPFLQKIHALVLYRWAGDQWAIHDKDGVKVAFREVVSKRYSVPEEEKPMSENLLENPGFEDGFREVDEVPEMKVAYKWEPWYDEDDTRPEFKIATMSVDPRRVHTGGCAQQWFTTYATHTAGIYQHVEDVPFGNVLHFEAWVQCFSSKENDFSHSEGGRYRMRIGIDPYGGMDYESSDVVWSGGGHSIQPYDQFVFLDVEVVAKSDRCTVFVLGRPEWKLRHNNGYVDSCALYATGQEPEPEPEPPPGGEWTEQEIKAIAEDAAHSVLVTAIQSWLDSLVGDTADAVESETEFALSRTVVGDPRLAW